MQQEESSTDYDGIYFLPGDEEGELVLSYFNFNCVIYHTKDLKYFVLILQE